MNLQEQTYRIREMMGIDEPKILFHGGHNLEGKEIRLPFFLSKKSIANWYAEERGGWINEFEVNFDNPLESREDWEEVLSSIGIDYNELDGEMVWMLNNKKDYGGDTMDIIYYEPFWNKAKEMGYDVVIGYDAGNQSTSGYVYLPLYKDRVKFINSYHI